MTRHLAPFALGLCALFVGCGSKELTRSKAKAIIEQGDSYAAKKRKLFINLAEGNTLVKGHYARWSDRFGQHFSLTLTEDGKRYFEETGGEAMLAAAYIEASGLVVNDPNLPTVGMSLYIEPKQPIKESVIEITGIASSGDQNVMKVDYRWQWDISGQPDKLTDAIPTLKDKSNDTAMFKLYDDGWRIVPK